MKALELIKLLEEKIDEVGDVDIAVRDKDGGRDDAVIVQEIYQYDGWFIAIDTTQL